MSIWEHLALTLVYLVQVSLSYSTMMVFMSLNIWLCLAVVLGHTGGYLFFGHDNSQRGGIVRGIKIKNIYSKIPLE